MGHDDVKATADQDFEAAIGEGLRPPRRLVVAGQKRIFNLEPGHDSGVHRVLLDETRKMVCLAFCGRLVSPREVRRRVVTRSDRDGTA